MDVQEYGCKSDEIISNDDDIVPDECWKEIHRGDSRKWILRDGYPKKSSLPVGSTMKATYPYPLQEERDDIGARRAILLKELYDQAAEEIIRERNEPPPVEEYCTEYDGNFSTFKKKIEDEEEERKRYEKFPLYTSSALSYWHFKIKNNQRGTVLMPGLTRSVDLKNPFKRNSGFTKPLSEVLDDCEL